MNRREFLSWGASSAVVSLGLPAAPVWRRAAAAAEARPDQSVLVVLELTGGNDGLNMVIPYADDLYHRNRPKLRISPGQVLKLNDQLGLHPAMTEIYRLWDAGRVAIIENVGYANPNRSHFRSMEIWQAGELGAAPTTGWLGRAADRAGACGPSPAANRSKPADEALGLCYVGENATPAAFRRRTGPVSAVNDVADCRLQPPAILEPGTSDDERVAAVRRELESAGDLARRLASAGDVPTSADTLAGRLATVHALLTANAPFRVYYTALGGFDTHVSQPGAHRVLLQALASALGEFMHALDVSKLSERIVVLVFSEFGRRVRENDQLGTDHGAAAPVLVIGKPVRGGLIGTAPNLANLDEGDIRYQFDFRRVYATLLASRLAVDPVPILGGNFETLPFL